MAGKQELILEYIRSLAAGEKVSVRSLAKDLSVSEGTAYKAIKAAEIRGMVVTRPKAGTVRVDASAAIKNGATSIAMAAKWFGLTILSGADNIDAPINSVVLGDGNMEQFRQSLAHAGPKPLVIVGDRPDIHQEAVLSGANLLATGGAQVNHIHRNIAEENGACVVSSEQDSYTILNLMHNHIGVGKTTDSNVKARDWMSMPLYLYYDDIVADWHRLFSPLFSMSSQCAVVDDDLKICGSVNAISALLEVPSQRISNICTQKIEFCIADENTPMQVLAEKMISGGTGVAFITHEGKMSGVLTANDVLRFYQFRSGDGGAGFLFAQALETIDYNKKKGRYVFMFKVPENDGGEKIQLTNHSLPLIIAAAEHHTAKIYGDKCTIDSGTFYVPNKIVSSGEIMISSELMKKTTYGCTLELEMYDDSACYAKCTLMMSVPDYSTSKEEL